MKHVNGVYTVCSSLSVRILQANVVFAEISQHARITLTFTTLWANSTDDIFKYFPYFSQKNRL